MTSRPGDRRRSGAAPAVIGVADHNGWAVLVSAAAVDGQPTVVDRRRVRLIDPGVPSQPYHHETLARSDAESERLLKTVRESIAACTALALDSLVTDLSPHYRIASIAIRQPPLADLPATVAEVHRSYHVTCRADGMLYHSAICTAARGRGWTVALHPRGVEVARAAEAMQSSVAEVERILNDAKRRLKAPWTAEHRHAFAAAIAGLSDLGQLRPLPTAAGVSRGAR